MEEHMDAHSGVRSSYEFCTNYGMKLRYDVLKSDQLPQRTVKIIKMFHRNVKSSKITNFRVVSGAPIIMLAKR